MTRMLIRFLDLIFNVWQSEQERRTSYRESLEITKNHFEKRLMPWHLRMTLGFLNSSRCKNAWEDAILFWKVVTEVVAENPSEMKIIIIKKSIILDPCY